MKTTLTFIILKFRMGRVCFHVVACFTSHKYEWHYKGIQRELPFLPLLNK